MCDRSKFRCHNPECTRRSDCKNGTFCHPDEKVCLESPYGKEYRLFVESYSVSDEAPEGGPWDSGDEKPGPDVRVTEFGPRGGEDPRLNQPLVSPRFDNTKSGELDLVRLAEFHEGTESNEVDDVRLLVEDVDISGSDTVIDRTFDPFPHEWLESGEGTVQSNGSRLELRVESAGCLDREDTCSDGHECVRGTCMPENYCEGGDDCADEEVCATTMNRCVPDPYDSIYFIETIEVRAGEFPPKEGKEEGRAWESGAGDAGPELIVDVQRWKARPLARQVRAGPRVVESPTAFEIRYAGRFSDAEDRTVFSLREVGGGEEKTVLSRSFDRMPAELLAEGTLTLYEGGTKFTIRATEGLDGACLKDEQCGSGEICDRSEAQCVASPFPTDRKVAVTSARVAESPCHRDGSWDPGLEFPGPDLRATMVHGVDTKTSEGKNNNRNPNFSLSMTKTFSGGGSAQPFSVSIHEVDNTGATRVIEAEFPRFPRALIEGNELVLEDCDAQVTIRSAKP